MTANTPARRAALLRLLEDWEAGRMTQFKRHGPSYVRIVPPIFDDLWRSGYIAHNTYVEYCLTPAGLAAARQAKEEADG